MPTPVLSGATVHPNPNPLSMSLPVVICGESLLDVFQERITPAGLALDAVVGGSPLNVAVGVARLGRPTIFLGPISRDFLGERIDQAIRAEGIDPCGLVPCDAPTTLSLIGLDAHGVPSYRFYGHGGADRQLHAKDLARLPKKVAALHFGSYACVVEPIGTTIRQLVQERFTSTVIAYDPNIRLNVEPDIEVWRATVRWMSYRTHLLKLSDEDFALLYPNTSPAEQAAVWRAAGVRLVVLTQGGQGAQAWCAAGHCEVRSPSVTVADTVGAGDTFQAATLVALAELGLLTPEGLGQLSLETCQTLLSFAAQAAAITCTRRGPDLPRRGELPSLV
ncbi:carbohydrate kinase [Leptothrix ochracea]|uniref:carbohydrate kinase family protein n=1 Tax=Leptothrix ochracea TaxID=735331 RepID=UPI0034E2A919